MKTEAEFEVRSWRSSTRKEEEEIQAWDFGVEGNQEVSELDRSAATKAPIFKTRESPRSLSERPI